MTTAAIPSRSILSLENPQHRLFLFVLLIGAAVLSPNITMPAGIPAIRLEQLVMGLMLPSLALFHLRNRQYLRLTLLDGVFLLLAVAITTSIILAPTIVASVDWSIRDPFEVARVVEYWLMYRYGMTLVPSEYTARTILYSLLGGSILMTAFSLIQYLDGLGQFNEVVTDWWSVGHNLVGVQREGRVIGTIGNANYYSFFMALPIIGGLAIVLLKKQLPTREALAFVIVGVVASVVSAVLSQSRTGAASILFGMTAGLLLVLAFRRPAAPFKAIGLFLGSVVLAVAFIQVQPPLVDSFNSRFNPTKVGDDASFIIRIQRFKTFFTGFFAEKPAFCEGDTLDKRLVSPSHKPRDGALVSTAPPEVLARDATRKADVATITNGVLAYFCEEGSWPAGEGLEEKLVPDHMPSMPVDPQTGEDYLTSIDGSGFWVGAELEDPADPDGPNYALGTNPNIIRNPSFDGTSAWGAREAATLESVDGGLFSNKALKVTIPPGGDVRQFIVFDFPLGVIHTAAAWIKSDTGKDEQMQLYILGQEAGGGEHDPVNYLIKQPDGSYIQCKDLERASVVAEECRGIFTAPASGQWVPISVVFLTDPRQRFTTVQFMLRSNDTESTTFLVDGAQMTQGDFAPSFLRVSDVDPASLRPVDLPQFSDSPYVGVGPRNNAEAGSFDNEYVLFLDRFGLLGAGPYLAMYFCAIAVAIGAWRKRARFMDVMGLTGFAFTMTLLLFNVGAGSYYHFAIMAIYWLFMGYLATSKRIPAGEAVTEPSSSSEPSPATKPSPRVTPGREAPQASAVRRD